MPAATEIHFTIDEVAPNFFFIQGASSNWTLVADGGKLTMIDSGYPGESASVDASVEATGHKPSDVATVLVTHAHADHVGSVERYRRDSGATVGALREEAPHLRREFLEQISVEYVLSRQDDVLFAAWFDKVKKLDPFADVAVADVTTIDAGIPLPFPGAPIAIATPGHTSGHTSYFFQAEGILVTGDAFITGHETSRVQGPQMLARAFHHDMEEAVASLQRLEGLDVRLVLPGHGPKWAGDFAAVTAAIRAGVKA